MTSLPLTPWEGEEGQVPAGCGVEPRKTSSLDCFLRACSSLFISQYPHKTHKIEQQERGLEITSPSLLIPRVRTPRPLAPAPGRRDPTRPASGGF